MVRRLKSRYYHDQVTRKTEYDDSHVYPAPDLYTRTNPLGHNFKKGNTYARYAEWMHRGEMYYLMSTENLAMTWWVSARELAEKFTTYILGEIEVEFV